MASGESHFATRAARISVIAAAVAAVLAAGLDVVEKVIAVPSLPEGILRERVTVTEFRRIEDPQVKPKVEVPLIEHTADESAFEVDANRSRNLSPSRNPNRSLSRRLLLRRPLNQNLLRLRSRSQFPNRLQSPLPNP